ncbi:NADH-quinone oxidoreductase subunit N [Halocalculus aciditolerans]|uniref:Oxidoreductase n=1 Tax=Halocalculus aciditolerans TaxID=1383812 RepID=A0A830FML3_9EURY|nr:NADH-quinone oxidoreductase subunit N [Halocalculus aciditolerans]GGL61348.1 oxidoreductase [Halocalculus aciditolerans]
MTDALFTLPALTPVYLFGLTALLVLGIDTLAPAARKNGLLAATTALGALAATGVAAWFLGKPGTSSSVFTPFENAIVVDPFALFFVALFGVVTALVAVASYDYVRDLPHQASYYALVLLAGTGMALMAVANDLAAVFIALELVSLPSYALVAYLKHNEGSVEGALKYFLVGALSSATMLYGVSLVYGATGTMRLGGIADAVTSGTPGGLLGLGVVLVAVGFLFKTASVPVHFWAPEAYEGAPAPVSAFLSSASKAAGFAAAFRVFTVAFPLSAVSATVDWALLFAVLAAVTMTLGNFAAATQTNVKRMLAYSSIGQAGYVLIGLAAVAGSVDSQVVGASMTHLFVYGFMNTGAFLFVALVEHWGVGRTFADYDGLAKRAPVACAAMTVVLFSLAGLPVGAGFLSKYVLFLSAWGAGFGWLVAIAIVNSALSVFYYSRVVKAMWVNDADDGFDLPGTPAGLYAGVLAAAVGTVLLLGGFGAVYETAQHAASLL